MSRLPDLQLCLGTPVVVADSVLDEIANHVAFLGYVVKRMDGYLEITQPGRYSWTLRDMRGGIFFRKIFATSEQAKRERERLLGFANGLNLESTFARFCVDGDGDLAIEAWYPNLYERVAFGRFVGLMELELREIFFRKKAEVDALLR